MSTLTTARPNDYSRFRKLRVALGWTLALVVGAYFYSVAVSRYVHFDAMHYGVFWPARWWLVVHLGSASLALLLGPVQFVSVIRRRYATVHRWIGRTYLLGVLAGSITAIYMSIFVDPSRAAGLSLLFLAVAWVTTSSTAFVAALRRQFSEHREWMIRSYVVTFAFVVYRLVAGSPLVAGLSPEESAITRGWFCWSIPLLLTEVALSWQRILGRKAPSRG